MASQIQLVSQSDIASQIQLVRFSQSDSVSQIQSEGFSQTEPVNQSVQIQSKESRFEPSLRWSLPQIRLLRIRLYKSACAQSNCVIFSYS